MLILLRIDLILVEFNVCFFVINIDRNKNVNIHFQSILSIMPLIVSYIFVLICLLIKIVT